jgi:hypothetical protein
MVDLCKILESYYIADNPDVNANNEISDDNGIYEFPYSVSILYEIMPVILRDIKCTWKVLYTDNRLYLKWSVCEELINVGINSVEEFKIKTLFGSHKKSMSERNGFKYSAAINRWEITSDGLCVFKLEPILVDGDPTMFEVVVRHENCEINRFELELQLTNHTNNLWLDKNLNETIKHFCANINFTKKLFCVKTKNKTL